MLISDNSSFSNGTNVTKFSCEPVYLSQEIFSWIDLFNSTLIPFTFMVVCSLFLVHYVFTARRKIKINATFNEMKRLRKDIQFSVNIMLLNVDFMVFNLPICIADLVVLTRDFRSKLDLLFYTQYACNLFVYLASNKIFREEFLLFIRVKDTPKRSTVYRVSKKAVPKEQDIKTLWLINKSIVKRCGCCLLMIYMLFDVVFVVDKIKKLNLEE